MFKNFSVDFGEREYGIFFYVMFANTCFTYLLTIISVVRNLSKDFKKNKDRIVLSFLFIFVQVIILLLGNL